MNNCFITDLDGTLLRSDATLSDFTVTTLTQAIRSGHQISYATARSYVSSNRIVSSIPWNLPLILYNGALIYDSSQEKVLDGNWLNSEITNEIIRLGKANHLVPLLFTLDSNGKEIVLHEELVRTGDLQFYRSRPNDPRFRKVNHLRCLDSYKTLIVTYIGLYDELNSFQSLVTQKFDSDVHIHFMRDQYIVNHFFLEFSHPKANKREGVMIWSERVGCKPQDITVFGDNLNDIGMFEVAGRRIAVSNAHERLRRMADQIVESNDEDGVAKYISQTTKSISQKPTPRGR